MTTLGGLLALLASFGLLAGIFRDAGYRRGYKDGYAKAAHDLDAWWLRVEREMEEGERKMREAEGR